MFIKQGKTNIKYLLIVIILAAIVGGGVLWCWQNFPSYQSPEAGIPEKRSTEECQKYTEVECPEGCIVCPPCEACSSFGCYSAEHCESMGFDEGWYEMVKFQRETADWQTYRNEEYGFEIKYPEEFDTYKGCELEEEKNGYTFGFDVIFGVRVGTRIELSILDSQGLNLSEYAYKEFPKAWEEIEVENTNGQVLKRTFVEAREDINIGDEEAIRVKHYSGGMGRYGEDVFLLKNDKIYRFSVFSGITCGGLEEEMKSKDISIFDYFNQILSTFRFIEPITEPIPMIDSISPDSGPIGTLIEIRGKNFSGFEEDLNAWIENTEGIKGIIYGEADSNDNLIKFTLNSSYCQIDTSYSGLACPDFIYLTSGTYKIYVMPWGQKSNEVIFTVISQ